MDFSDLLLGPHYAVGWGVPATLTVDTVPFEITALDMTAGVGLSGPVEVETVRPSARIRAVDLADLGLVVGQLDDAAIELNGKSWTIIAHRMLPSPSGEADGEVALMLEGAEG